MAFGTQRPHWRGKMPITYIAVGTTEGGDVHIGVADSAEEETRLRKERREKLIKEKGELWVKNREAFMKELRERNRAMLMAR
jgi:hypothetical protein